MWNGIIKLLKYSYRQTHAYTHMHSYKYTTVYVYVALEDKYNMDRGIARILGKGMLL